MGVKAEIKKMTVDGERNCDVLYVNGRALHWDTAAERAGQAKMVKDAFGDVLAAGYGLGISQQVLLRNPKVKWLFTVEKYRQVLDLCHDYYGMIYGQVSGTDIYRYFASPLSLKYNQFDTIIGDIWSGSIAADVAGYKKFRKAAEKHLKPGGIILMGPRGEK